MPSSRMGLREVTVALIILVQQLRARDVNITEPDFPDISPLIQSLLIDARDDKVMKASVGINASTKFVVNRPAVDKISTGPSTNEKQEITETDMYLLNAIEKLAYRLDAMEKRLRRTEELLLQVMEGSNIKRQDACPANFTRVARNCYHFSERLYNWKSAASMCKSLGSNLIEIESRDEFMEVVTYLQSNNRLRGYDFWTGGLNPGLLWIWANSARPILPKKPSNRPDENVYGSGRCLKLAINQAKLYQYHGMDCAIRLKYICEHEENSTIRALKKLQKSLVIKEEE
ncbi:oxidized low-density lipoprotein receptor 1-like [Cimex lectularius]|uniref:C-type lectin domain-containing protein n=1 Tax=Cimex lectularius TaxID=79782 RepID=A0A8I6S2W1_CIMLE|nr:oxidized low-density lipoprotein receptor 1-like [Cimex lectularius]